MNQNTVILGYKSEFLRVANLPLLVFGDLLRVLV
jgi:hypothetical protein